MIDRRLARRASRLTALALSVLSASPIMAHAQQGAAPALAHPLSKAEASLITSVAPATIKQVTSDLSAPTMEGRGTATPGGEKAARYIADRFQKLGLKPLGDDGGYLQSVKFRATQFLPETALKCGDVKLKFGEEFVIPPQVARDKASASGELVLVGYGVVSEKLKRDDLAGLDLKGKIAVVLSGQPDGVDPKAWAEAANPFGLSGNLIGRGAVGLILVSPTFGKASFERIADYLTRRSVAPADRPAGGFPAPPIALVGTSGAEKLFSACGMSYSDVSTKAKTGESVSRLLGKEGTIEEHLSVEEVTGSNVAGVLEGSDPKLKDQAIVYSAHYDAFGVGMDGRIYPGAADNAIGVAEILSIAEAFAHSKTKPRRSVIFLAVTGEEHGLLGAYHWAKNPTWPIENVAADINYDGIGTEIYGPVKNLVGFGAEHSELGPIFESVAASMNLNVVPDPMPEEKAFYRSDHLAFVKQGVPALMLLGGPAGETEKWIARARAWMDTDYHQATDIVRPDWDWSGAQTVAQVGLVVGLRVANADAMPEWNKTSEFYKPRVVETKAASSH